MSRFFGGVMLRFVEHLLKLGVEEGAMTHAPATMCVYGAFWQSTPGRSSSGAANVDDAMNPSIVCAAISGNPNLSILSESVK